MSGIEIGWMVVQIAAGVLAADLVSGIVHWLEDAYGKEDLPIIGPSVIEPNIRHHYSPLDFTRASYVKRNGPIFVIGAIIACLFALVGWINAFTLALLIAGSQANETHRWAHLPTHAVPRYVRVMQNNGLFLSRKHHGGHHRPPFAVRYCTLTNLMNPVLDQLHVLRGVECIIRVVFGVERRCDTGQRPSTIRQHAP